MKKIHITESQLGELRKRLTEVYDVDVTDKLEAGKTPTQVVSDMTAENPNLNNDASSGEVKFTFNPKGIDEEEDVKPITKKAIKEAKIKKLQENCVRYTKKDLK